VRRIAVQCGPSDHLIRKRSRVRVLDRRSRAAAPLVANRGSDARGGRLDPLSAWHVPRRPPPVGAINVSV
jgi:hypothetical protein